MAVLKRLTTRHNHLRSYLTQVYLEETSLTVNSYFKYTRLLSLSGDKGDQWNKATIRLGRIQKSFRLSFDGFRALSAAGDLAIDDIRMVNCQFPQPRPTACPANYFTCGRKACISQSRVCDLTDDCGDSTDELNCANFTQCDFENGICDWKDSFGQGTDLKWAISTGATTHLETGPSRDHTTGSSEGHYVYLEASNPPGSTARLESPVVLPASNNCQFRFFYHMYGKDIGTLSVYKKTATGLDRVFVKTGEVGDFWERSVLDLSGESQPYQLVIEGVVGKSFLGDIGIDDTSFTDGCVLDKTGQISTQATTTVTTQAPCGEPGQFQCLNKKCIGEDKVCNFVDDCGDGSDEAECGTCDFESGMCGFYDKSEDMFRWNRTKAPSGISTGPKVDHTTNSISGHYLVTYEDLDLGGWLNYALLFGPRLQATGKAIILYSQNSA